MTDLTSLYHRAPVALQNAAVSAYGLRLRLLREGRVRRRELRRLRETQWLSAPEIKTRQERRALAMANRAYRSVPLYRDRLPDFHEVSDPREFSRLPVLEKHELRTDRKRLVTERFQDDRLQEVHTGGTTGTPLTIYCNRSVLQRNYAFFDRFKEWAGVGREERVATFAGRNLVPPEQTEPPFWRFNAANRQLLFSSYHIAPSSVGSYAEELSHFAPALIDSYPSSLRPIARHIVESGGPEVRPKAVVTSSETLDDATRRLIETAFDCPVFDHYGAAEMAAFVTQCAEGTYHVNPEFGLVEILEDGEPVQPGEEGEIVATGFINPVMPLVRYATGDRAVAGAEGCGCGRAFPVIERILGRMDDVLVTPEGRRIGRLDPIFKAVTSFYETRIVQDARDHVVVEVVAGGPGDPEADETRLREELGLRLGPSVVIDIERVDSISRTGRGKLRTVENRVVEDA